MPKLTRHGLAKALGNYDQLVDAFDHHDEIFDQATYEVNVESQADLMIALEALKNEFRDLREAMAEL